MKKWFRATAFFAFAITSAVQAQHSFELPGTLQQNALNGLPQLNSPQLPNVPTPGNPKTNAMQSRLVAATTYGYKYPGAIYGVFDSTVYYYSNGREGNVLYQKCDSSRWYGVIHPDPDIRRTMVYNTANNLMVTNEATWDAANSIWVDTTYTLHHYNSANMPVGDTLYQFHTGKVISGRRCVYNSSNQITEYWESYFEGYRYDYFTEYEYNSLGQLVSTTVSSRPSSTDPWYMLQRFFQWYDQAGNSVRRVQQAQSETDSFNMGVLIYDTNNLLVETRGYSYFNQMGLQTDTPGRLTGHEFYNYNADNKLTGRIQWWDHDNGDSVLGGAGYYYYEDYFPTSVAKLTQQGGKLNLYPVPASNTLNIDVQWDTKQAYTLTIADVQGRVVLQSHEQPAQQVIDISHLPTGAYNLILQGDKGALQHSKFTVVR